MDSIHEIITAAEAAEMWGLQESTVRRALWEGRLPGRKSSGTWLTTTDAMREAYGERRAEMADWDRYLGSYTTPEEYKAQGGSEETLRQNLQELWGDPAQGNDYMSPDEIQRVAAELADYADL